jgi:hypothetical protein
MVSKQDQQVYEAVLARDRLMYWGMQNAENPVFDLSLEAWLATDPWVCVAPIVDPSVLGHCSGQMERDHIHEHHGGTKAKRALTTLETLSILCRHHHQDGWATSHRDELRSYIKEANERYRTFTDRPSTR